MHGGGGYSNPFLLRLSARLTAGTRTPGAAAPDRWLPYEYYQHKVLRWLETVGRVGAATDDIEPRLAVAGDDVAASVQGGR